ncbi:MAG: ParB/RepB/Spo0J family partition protein [Bacilli bacterium]|nr:ParB/RepB/Spo0J family partition protein [Bacilli bacterium]
MNEEQKEDVTYIHLDDIIPNRFQPREVFDERTLKELAVSIKEHGVIQPIIVRNVNGKYEIIAGERRYKASALAGLTKIPAIVRNLDDKETAKIALLENLQRKNLNAVEEARTYQKILELDEMTQEELAKTMGKSQSAVANKIRLLSLPDEIQEAVLKEKISERHARALLNIPDQNKQKELLNTVIEKRMPVRKLEQKIKELYPKEEDNNKNEPIGEIVSMDNSNLDIPQTDVSATTTDFVDNSPLKPSTDIEEEENSDYGKIVVAPPEGEETETPKFINFGEIDDDEEGADETEIAKDKSEETTTIADVEEIKSNSIDINSTPKQKTGSDLDSLLNISATPNQNIEPSKFLTPAESIVKTDDLKEEEKPEDYFKTPDLINIDLPDEIQTKDTKNVSIKDLEKEENQTTIKDISIDGKYTIQEAVEKARELVGEINSNGLNADMEEMNFNKSYQIIIKIEKEVE